MDKNAHLKCLPSTQIFRTKVHPPSAHLKYGQVDNISPKPLICYDIERILGKYPLHIYPDVPKKLALR